MRIIDNGGKKRRRRSCAYEYIKKHWKIEYIYIRERERERFQLWGS